MYVCKRCTHRAENCPIKCAHEFLQALLFNGRLFFLGFFLAAFFSRTHTATRYIYIYMCVCMHIFFALPFFFILVFILLLCLCVCVRVHNILCGIMYLCICTLSLCMCVCVYLMSCVSSRCRTTNHVFVCFLA